METEGRWIQFGRGKKEFYKGLKELISREHCFIFTTVNEEIRKGRSEVPSAVTGCVQH